MKKWLNFGVMGVAALLMFSGFKLSVYAENAPASNDVKSSEKLGDEFGGSAEMVERFRKNFSFCNNGNLDADAEAMFEKFKDFLEEAKNVSEEKFFDYEADYLKNHCSKTNQEKIRVESSDWFNQNEKNEDYLVVYKGVPKKEIAGSVHCGDVCVDGKRNDTSGLDMSNGIHINPSFKLANAMAYSFVEVKDDKGEDGITEKRTGEVVKLAMNKAVKLIHRDYLQKVINKMIEKNPDYFKDYLHLVNLYGDLIGSNGTSVMRYNPWFNNFKYLAEFVKANTGFDYYAVVGNKSAEDCAHELREKVGQLLGMNIGHTGDFEHFLVLPDEKLTPEQKQKREEFEKFMLDNEPQKKGWCISKVGALCANFGLLAKFLGFDGYTNCPIDGDNASEEDRKMMPMGGQFVIVDIDNLVVCSDVCEEELKN